MTIENVYCKKCKKFLGLRITHWWSQKTAYKFRNTRIYLNDEGKHDYYCDTCETVSYTLAGQKLIR